MVSVSKKILLQEFKSLSIDMFLESFILNLKMNISWFFFLKEKTQLASWRERFENENK